MAHIILIVSVYLAHAFIRELQLSGIEIIAYIWYTENARSSALEENRKRMISMTELREMRAISLLYWEAELSQPVPNGTQTVFAPVAFTVPCLLLHKTFCRAEKLNTKG